MIFYKNYTYSPKATFVSAGFSLLAAILLICAIALGVEGFGDKNVGAIIGAVVLLVAAVPTFIYGSRKLPDKIAAKDGPKNIYTKPRFALMFVRRHPEAYEQICQRNPAFAAKYVRDPATGKIVKRK